MKNIIITSGSDGIGKALAKALSSNLHVTLLARNIDKLERLSNEVSCDHIACDMRYSKVRRR